MREDALHYFSSTVKENIQLAKTIICLPNRDGGAGWEKIGEGMNAIAMNTPSQRKAFFSAKSRFLLYLLAAVLLAYNFETIKFYVFYKQECVLNAVDIGEGKKLGVCDWHVIDKINGTIAAIVYDTSDQLVRPEKQHSPKWQTAANKLGLRQLFTEQDPVTKNIKFITKDIYGAIVPLGGHFYRITS